MDVISQKKAAEYYRTLSKEKIYDLCRRAGDGDKVAAGKYMKALIDEGWVLRKLGCEVGEDGRLRPWHPFVVPQYFNDLYEHSPKLKPDLALTDELCVEFSKRAKEWVDSIMIPHLKTLKDKNDYLEAEQHLKTIMNSIDVEK